MAYEIRICCGVPKSLFEVLVNHLEPFKCRFQTFELEEAATRVRVERSIKLSTISKTIRICKLIWAGPNPYLKETQELYSKKNAEDNSEKDDDGDGVSSIRRDAKTVKPNAIHQVIKLPIASYRIPIF